MRSQSWVGSKFGGWRHVFGDGGKFGEGNEKLNKENENIRQEKEKFSQENGKIAQENEKFGEGGKFWRRKGESFLRNASLKSISFSISQKLYDFLIKQSHLVAQNFKFEFEKLSYNLRRIF